ncbi:type VI secretion system protein TssA [Stieleria sp. TO1_6]|uniref:type VI secretion system protein TssA n=1 Tax=Stieleria tagensis TaxID=2956795 RepID=UPI00209AB622|nr:type VI secretion system protein TssA [Stieleria tagensis]MCO8121099.1 type VI secretion system protein TssA [Stieleria tagensis]
MADSPTLDFETLLAPISDEAPSGSYLRRTDFERFQTAKDARAAAVNAERKIREYALFDDDELAALNDQGQGVEIPSSPDWRSVLDLCCEIIANHSKDLWVASWLIEANTRCNGFAGARDGFQLVSQLCDQYWDGIYPPHDEDDGYLDTASQLASLNGMDGPGTLIAPLEELPLVPDHDALTFAAYRQATEQGGGDVNESDFHAAARAINADSLQAYGLEIQSTVAAFATLTDVLESKFRVDGEDDCTPPSSQIRRTLETIQQTFTSLTRDLLESDSASSSDDEGAADTDTSTTGMTHNGASNIDLAQAQVNNREDAFKMLIKASEFFRKTEPHSPVSYMLQQAVEFGRMDLPTLLGTLIRDEDVLKNFAERVGIPVKPDHDDED